MSKYVVDSNYLQSPKLREYLAKSSKNFALLTDFTFMEAVKGNTLASIYKSMEIVSSFPDQVIILKFSSAAKLLRGRPSELQRRMINKEQTRGFPKWSRQLALAKDGKLPGLVEQLVTQGRVASAHMHQLQSDMERYGELLEKVAQAFTSTEIKVLRSRVPLADAITDKMRAFISEWAVELFTESKISKLPPPNELRNTFLFQFSLCACFMALHWIGSGGVRNVRSSKLLNDIVDVNIMTFATFFDGFLSEDAKATRIYSNAKFFLEQAKRVVHDRKARVLLNF